MATPRPAKQKTTYIDINLKPQDQLKRTIRDTKELELLFSQDSI